MPGQALPKEVTWLGALVLQPGLFNIVMFPRTLLCFSNFFHSRVDVLYLMLGSRNPTLSSSDSDIIAALPIHE